MESYGNLCTISTFTRFQAHTVIDDRKHQTCLCPCPSAFSGGQRNYSNDALQIRNEKNSVPIQKNRGRPTGTRGFVHVFQVPTDQIDAQAIEFNHPNVISIKCRYGAPACPAMPVITLSVGVPRHYLLEYPPLGLPHVLQEGGFADADLPAQLLAADLLGKIIVTVLKCRYHHFPLFVGQDS